MLARDAATLRDPRWLRQQALGLLTFYYHRTIDHTHGGYVTQVSDLDGTVYEPRSKLLPGTARLVHNFAIGSALDGPDWCESAAVHGLRHLETAHRDADRGGYAWLLDGRDVADPTRKCYGHAFALLAHATIDRVGIGDAYCDVDRVATELLEHFWEDEHDLCRVECTPEWEDATDYRGQNANMHACEAFLAAHGATDEEDYLDRAYRIANALARELSARGDDLIWEHYNSDWEHDWTHNEDQPDDVFRPWGYQPGHLLEWSKLLAQLAAHREESWLLERAETLFAAAVEDGWDDQHGGFVYTFDRNGTPVVERKYFWPCCEGIGAAALLHEHTGDDEYRSWYDRIWTWALDNLVNPKYGNWYFQVAPDGSVDPSILDQTVALKVGYHQIGAIETVLGTVDDGDSR